MRISAVINTRNEERNITRCLKSLVPYVGEIVVVDMQSSDRTVELARNYTDRIWSTQYVGYVEPARNFAIGKASGEWIFILDADEVLGEELGVKLQQLADTAIHSYYRIPRKNLIFGKWMKHSGWWPDYQIRFFKSGAVSWNDEIHSLPVTYGHGTDLPAENQNALLHYHYENVGEFLDRLNRYTTAQARQLLSDGYKFEWQNLLRRPTEEFLSRFFMREGYKDGVHGLALSLLQAFSFLIVELKVWEAAKFTPDDKPQFLDQTMGEFKKIRQEFCYWYYTQKSVVGKRSQKFIFKILAKFKL